MLDRDCGTSTPMSWMAGLALVVATASAHAIAQARDFVISDLRGTATRTAGARAQPLNLLDAVKPGDRIRIASDSQIAVFNPVDATLFVLNGPVEVTVQDRNVFANGRAVEARVLDAAYRNLRVTSENLVQGSMVMRGSPRVRVTAPEGRVPDGEARRFRWSGDESAWTLEIATQEGTLVHRVDVRGSEYLLPVSVPLQTGVKYVWGIAPGDGARALDWTEFTVESDAPAHDVGAGRILRAALLQQRGMPHAAQRVLEEVAPR